MLNPGTIISDRYEIVRLIGEGGMGSVYEAKHRQIGKRVAIKVLDKEYSNDAEALARFKQEAKIAGNIGHLNICEVTDFGVTDDGLTFLVMEYLEGESLADILKREKRLPADIALGVIRQTLEALEEVHAKGIVHRDLKPENVYITNVKGHGLVVKLLDFGISKVMKADEEALRLTKTGTMIGTPYYMSPEQVRAKGNVDHRTDLYCCGVICYEMLTGRVPYGGTTYSEVMFRIIEDAFPDPRKTVSDIPQKLVKLIHRSMHKNPAKRIQSASTFLDEIKKLQLDIGGGKAAGIPSTKMASMVGTPSAIIQRAKGMHIALFGGIVGALILAIIGAILLVALSGENEPDDSKSCRAATGILPALSIVAPMAETAYLPPEGQELVRITITNTPEKARIIFGNKILNGNVLEVPRGTEPIIITILSAGFQERDIEVVPSKDATVDGRLRPIVESTASSKPKEKEGATKEKVSQTDAKPKDHDPDLEKKSKKKKMKPVWDLYPGS